MPSIFGTAGFFGRLGSGAFWAQRVDNTIKPEDREFVISPPSWDLSKMPDQVLISIDDDGVQLRVQSAIPNFEYDWRGPAVPRASIFKYLLGAGYHSWDVSNFIDYVYTFRQVLYNIKTHSFSGVDTQEPLHGMPMVDEALIRSAMRN